MRWMWMLLVTLLVGCGSSDEASQEEPIVLHPSEGGEDGESNETEPPPEEVATDDRLVVGEDACETDADCVPAACCHAAACVAQANAPECGDSMCTAHCAPDTMDCGGGCLCHEGRCAARLADLPEPTVVE